MRLCDVGAAIQEVMESYEVEINGKVFQGNYPSDVRDGYIITCSILIFLKEDPGKGKTCYVCSHFTIL